MLKVAFFLITAFSLSFSALADKPRVVLLSSLETPRIWYHSSSWKIEKPLRNIFKRAFSKTEYDIVIKERVTPKQLREELLNPLNIALFWVSHSAGSTSSRTGINKKGIILDYYSHNVASLFKEVHPNLRYLALVGCDAKSLLESYESEGLYRDSKKLKLFSFDKKVDARRGLRKAIRDSERSLGRLKKKIRPVIDDETSIVDDFTDNYQCRYEEEVAQFEFVRTTKNKAQPALLKLNGYPLHVFEDLTDEREQVVRVNVPTRMIKFPMKLSLDSLKDFARQKIDLGLLEIRSQDIDGQWSLFSRANGTPVGVSRNLYRLLDGKLRSSNLADRYSCQ